MGTLYCVRHGQASFGAANYDQLSPLGERQAAQLGRYWRQKGLRFDAVYAGTLARHAQTAHHIAQGLFFDQNSAGVHVSIDFDAAVFDGRIQRTPALNEYDSEALIAAQLMANPPAAPLPSPHTPEGYKAHFRVLREALKRWIAGTLTPKGMPSFADFRAGIAQVADKIASQPHQTALIVSSGGPLSTLVMHTLRADALSMIDLNYQMKNTAISSFFLSQGKLHLSGFNALPHLDSAEFEAWLTST
jgi:broad specificity phosphatase PhoE